MAPNFVRYSLRDYTEQILKPAVGQVRFSEVHVHHTWSPTIADFRTRPGDYYVRAMWRFHTGTRGWSDIAQHATIDPDGFIWSGRSLLVPPASASGYNDTDNDGVHPFMFEMIGNFDKGEEKLEGAQLAAAAGLCLAIMKLWHRGLDMIRFHREFTTLKTCPGSGIDKAWFVEQVLAAGKEDDTLELTNAQRKMLVDVLKALLREKVITDPSWVQKAEQGTLTVSELTWLNTIILARK
ncbi:peptidoglycan recognition protein family protein [Cohnella kolymensis]|uniref:peptidoglycan recognition protein family protein n=1 Tax=Cohnella kolymensis TaxID=1590652 RepID=UPI0013791D3D|nr:peptidoglycan recognition family protein [Cohnella kolymensis]